MKLTAMRCPNCGGKLEKITEEKAHCSFCDTDFVIEDDRPVINNYYSSSTMNKKLVKKFRIGKLIFPFIIFVMVFGSKLLIGQSLKINNRARDSSSDMNINKPVRDYSQNKQSESKKSSDYRKKPESKAMKSFVEQVLKKEHEKISVAELATLTYLKISTEEETSISSVASYYFNYSLEEFEGLLPEDSQIKTLVIPQKDSTIQWKDLQAFTGLFALDLSGMTEIDNIMTPYDLTSLKKIVYYSGNFFQSPQDVLTTFADKDNIRALSLNLNNNSDMDALQEFTNLKSLNIRSIHSNVTNPQDIQKSSIDSLMIEHCDEIEWLSGFTGLKELRLGYLSKIEDFSPLYAMTKLEKLSLERAENLKDLEFIKNMPALNELKLTNSSIESLEALKSKKSLTTLELEDNVALTSLSEIATLSSLKKLKLRNFSGFSFEESQLEGLGHLEHLEKIELEDDLLPILANVRKVKDITLVTNDELDISRLSHLKEVTSLVISGRNDVFNIRSLGELPNLKQLTLVEATITEENNEPIGLFSLPQVEKINLIETELYLLPPKNETNTTLKQVVIFDSQSFTVESDGISRQNDAKAQRLTDYLTNCTGIEQLSLPSLGVENLDFLKTMTALQELDIEDNQVQDIGPLANLANLKVINIKKNPVKNIDLLTNQVFVIN